jgi:hypothetical protein
MFPVKRDSKRDPIGEWDEILLRVSCVDNWPSCKLPDRHAGLFRTLPIAKTFGGSSRETALVKEGYWNFTFRKERVTTNRIV